MRQHGGVRMTTSDALALRMRSLLLAGTPSKAPAVADSVAAVVTWFGAMQAQDYASGLWSIGARLPAMTHSGSGQLCLALAHRFPTARLVGVEFDPASVAQARSAVQDAGLEHRVQVTHADANQLADRDTYQLVVMNRSLHEVGGPDEHLNVLRRSKEALRADGWTIVSELPYPDNEADYRTNPDQRRLAGAQVHEAIVGCAMITTSQLAALMRNAGHDSVRVIDQPRSSRIVIIGQRPPQSDHRPTR